MTFHGACFEAGTRPSRLPGLPKIQFYELARLIPMRFLTDDTNSISNCKIPASVGAPIKRPSVKEKSSPMARKLPFSCRGTAVGLRAASASAALRLCRYFSRGDGASSPHQAPIWIKAITRGVGPLPQSGPEIPRFHAVSKLFLQTSWFLASPVMAHGMGSKESGLPDLVGASGLLIRPVVFPTPTLGWPFTPTPQAKNLSISKGTWSRMM